MALATYVFGYVRDLWNRWNIQAAMLASLVIQIILIFSARSRKRTKDHLKIFVIWSIYLLADFVAIFAIGLIYNEARPTYITTADVAAVGEIAAATQACSSSCDIAASRRQPKHIAALWAPFLLLHLGGPDTITAFSIEDNELWDRHLLKLIVQLVTVLLLFFRYQTFDAHNNPFLIPTLLIFVAGFIKYAERTYSLKLASLTNMMKSMSPKQPEKMPPSVMIEVGGRHQEVSNNNIINLTDTEVVEHAFKFYKIFRGLVVDHTFGFDEWKHSKSFFSKLESENAFKVMEVELNFMYEAMFTKMITVQGKILGYTFRLATIFLIVAATVFFVVFIPKNGIHHLDLKVTHCLLAGAVILDAIALIELFFSDWTVALILLSKQRCEWLKQCAQGINKVCKWISSRRRWSGKMYQYSFINHSLKKQWKWVNIILDYFGLKERVYSYLYTKRQPVTHQLRELIFNEVKEIATQTTAVANEIILSRGKRTLLECNCGESIMTTVGQDVGFIQSVLLWHIATEICYFNFGGYRYYDDDDDPEICRYISEYLLYLLVMEQKFTSALAGNFETRDTCEKIVETTFKDTHEEAWNFFIANTKQNPELFKRYASFLRSNNVVLDIYICLRSMWFSTRYAIRYIAKLICFFNKDSTTHREMTTLWEEWKMMKNYRERKSACESLIGKATLRRQEPSEVKGRSKSMLIDACILAKDLQDFGIDDQKQMWKMMRSVWVELLLYGACHCRGDAHAQQLAKGGELLTFVWLLMAHFGLGEQFRFQTVGTS
ncbi:PREDICTED: uncharacterized protein LOC109176561 [Ipomoea nil]|uniref:uncharacterized protein LOC109176561 n=1 Tax=Ipomoea nil TaxID=35883 RepID=UPI000901B9F5|nr:PREDICTED: uncharacterized protein LOC109176561 [Ipomoea nil]